MLENASTGLKSLVKQINELQATIALLRQELDELKQNHANHGDVLKNIIDG